MLSPPVGGQLLQPCELRLLKSLLPEGLEILLQMDLIYQMEGQQQ